MLPRAFLAAFLILSNFICFAQLLPDSQPGDPLSKIKIGRTVQSHPSSAGQRISVARLGVPSKARKLYNKAVSAIRKQKSAEARKEVEEALKLHPSFPDALTLRAITYCEVQEWAAAEQDLRAAIRIDPAFASPYIVLADCYNTQSRFDDALLAVQKANALTPGAWNVQYEIARALIGKHQYEPALKTVDQALQAQKKHGFLLHLAKAHALVGLKLYPQAKAELQSCLSCESSREDAQQVREMLRRFGSQASAGGQ